MGDTFKKINKQGLEDYFNGKPPQAAGNDALKEGAHKSLFGSMVDTFGAGPQDSKETPVQAQSPAKKPRPPKQDRSVLHNESQPDYEARMRKLYPEEEQ